MERQFMADLLSSINWHISWLTLGRILFHVICFNCHFLRLRIAAHITSSISWKITHPPQHPIAVSFTLTIMVAMSTWPVSSRGHGWSNSASTARGKTSFDKTNLRSWGVSPKFHKKLRQHNWRTSWPWFKWCMSSIGVTAAPTEFSFLLVKITGPKLF